MSDAPAHERKGGPSAWDVGFDGRPCADAGRSPPAEDRRGAPSGAGREPFPIVAVALGGLLFTCSVFRARYNERIRRLENEIVQLSILAERDHLTGLANRRSFERRLAIEWRRALRHGTHLTLALIDVDHFKLFNDTHGHPAGDRALQEVARSLAGCLERSADGVFRIGGEEFALILPDTDRAGAVLIAERVHRALRCAALPHGRNATGTVTVSFGSCSALVCDDDEAPNLRSLADSALYEAKNRGRDRAVCVRTRARIRRCAATVHLQPLGQALEARG